MDIVIGGGLAGLLTAYATGSTVVSRDIGGQLKTPFSLGPRILKQTPETERLIEDLAITIRPRRFHIGYLWHQSVSNYPTEDFRDLYYYKTRGIHKATSTSMSDGEPWIDGWDLGEIDLVNRLKDRISIIYQNVEHINPLNTIKLSNNTQLHANQIYSTIPLPKLFKLLGEDTVWDLCKSVGTYFIRTLPSYIPGLEELIGKVISNERLGPVKFSYVYCAELEIPFHRATLDEPGGWVILEVREDRYKEIEGSIDLFKKVFIPNCQLLNELNLTSYNGIELVGRYSQWSHGVRLHNILRRLGYGGNG